MKKKKQQTCPELTEGYVIGVDGGGTKTKVALADLKGRILAMATSGSSNPRNVGIKESAKNIAEAVSKVLKKIDKDEKILSTFIGLPAVEEEFRQKKKELKKELLKHKEISKIFKGKVIIGSDQITAFSSGTDKREGIVLIAGTGCVVHGWKGKKDLKVSGWGWINDEGSGFWTGQKAFQATFKELDGRAPKTLITKLVFRKLKAKNKEDLLNKVYSSYAKIIPSFSVLVDKAYLKGDKIATGILTEAGKELSLAANTLIKKLNLPRSRINSLRSRQKSKFPVVLVGSMFKSKIVLLKVQKEIKKIAPKAEFILPKKDPVIGAVKLALEHLTKNLRS